MNDYRELLLGCGHSREKRVVPLSASVIESRKVFTNLTTIDINPECNPDHVEDLQTLGYNWTLTEYGQFDEIHAYEVLEHIGKQGDYVQFFTQFRQLWRALKPGGFFCATVPHWQSIWAWGDPGHTRIISPASLVFLDRDEYAKQLGKTAMSDYRELLGDTNFKRVHQKTVGDTFEFVLQAVK